MGLREAFHAALERSELEITEQRFNLFRDDIARALTAVQGNRENKLAARVAALEGTVAGLDLVLGARCLDPAILALLQFEIEGAEEDLEVARMLLREHESRQPAKLSRKLSAPQETLLWALTRAWAAHVDPSIGLPSRDPHPDSPYLRFADEMLRQVYGESRPEKRVVLTFVADHVRPFLREGGVSRLDTHRETPPSEI